MQKSTRNNKKIALVTSGGGLKAAFYHLGFSKALEEKEIYLSENEKGQHIRTFVGSSGGAIFSALAASGFSLDDMIDSFTRGEGKLKHITYFDLLSFNKSLPRYFLKGLKKNHLNIRCPEDIIKNLLRIESPFSTDGIEEYIRSVLPTNDFRKLKPELFITGTRLNPVEGFYKDVFCRHDFHNEEFQALYRSDIAISEAVAASCAIPGLLAPRTIKSNIGSIDFIDGETRKTLSTHIARDADAELIFVSYTHVPYEFKENIGSLKKFGIAVVLTQAINIALSQRIENAKLIYTAKKDALDAIKEYANKCSIPDDAAKKLAKYVAKRLRYNSKLVQVTTHPTDNEFFLEPYLDPSKDCAKKIINHGYEQGLKDLNMHGF